MRGWMIGMLAMAVTSIHAAEPATDAWAEISLNRTGHANPDRATAIVIAIDGAMYPDTRARLTPGTHLFHIASSRAGRRGQLYYDNFMIDLAPCMRYVLAADHSGSTLAKNWELVIEKEEPIARCQKLAALPAADSSD